MRAIHKVIVLGAFGGAAAGLVAAGGAFACTPDADVWVDVAGEGDWAPVELRPGDPIDVTVNHFYESRDPYGPVEIHLVAQVPDPSEADGFKETYREYMGFIETPELVERGGFMRSPSPTTKELRIPAGAGSASGEYSVTADQFNFATNKIEHPRSDTVSVRGAADGGLPPAGTPGGPPPDGAPVGGAPVGGAPVGGAPVGGAPVPGPAPVPAGGSGSLGQTPGGAGGVARSGPSGAPAASATSKVRIAPRLDGIAVPADQPVAQEAIAPAAEGLPVRPGAQAQPGPSDLWSGVEPGRSLGLLDPLPSPSSGSNPLGGLLLAAGLMTMAGIAVAAGRQRLVLARRTSR